MADWRALLPDADLWAPELGAIIIGVQITGFHTNNVSLIKKIGNVPIREIGMLQWDLLVETLTKANRSKRMKEYVTGTLRRILKHAYHRGLIDLPPPTGKRIGATGPGSSNRRLRVINPDEAEAIMQKLKDTELNDWRVTRFAFLTGARVSECFKLRWRDIDRSQQLIIFPETKNRDARDIPITDALETLLDELPPCPIDVHVFVKKDGTPYKEAPYSFRTVVEALKLNEGRSDRDRISFHSIRHSAATELAKTLNPRDLMGVMGWRTVQMAMRYVHTASWRIQFEFRNKVDHVSQSTVQAFPVRRPGIDHREILQPVKCRE